MSNNEKTFTHYRIGDFAKYLGVTSDFLKHYEEAGLIDVVQRASGYRYYPFNQAARVIEYMRLRNYGVTVKEMNGVLTGNSEDAVAFLDERAGDIRGECVIFRVQGKFIGGAEQFTPLLF